MRHLLQRYAPLTRISRPGYPLCDSVPLLRRSSASRNATSLLASRQAVAHGGEKWGLRPFGILAVLGLVILSSALASAQPPQPAISLVFPAGGQRGKTFEAAVTGRDLQGTSAVRFNGAGVSANVVKVENPNLVRISVTVAPDAELGERDVRLVTPGGISTRFRFFVGDLPEVNEVEPNSEKAKPQRLESFPIVVNGQLPDDDRDFYRLPLKAGQTVVFEFHGRRLLPYIADAVPGWLDACLTLFDASGKQVAFANDFRFYPDPVMVYTVPKDEEYLLEVKDFVYRGRPDFIYRLRIGALPYVTHVFPLGGQRNTPAALELFGVNLPAKTLSFPIPADSPAVRQVGLTASGPISNVLPFAAGDTPEARETEPNDALAQANRVTLPVTINGRIQKAGDADYFIFAAQAGQGLAMEVQARRLASPVDSLLTLYNAQGQEITENDDWTDPTDALVTHHADSRIVYTFPAAGDFVLRIKDIQGKGGEEYAYRLVLAPPRPDFTLRITPDNNRVARGDSVVIPVNALRLDGFGGEITLAVQNLPPGFAASEAVIPAGQDQTRLTITAPGDAPLAVVAPTIAGTATIGTAPATRTAFAAEDIMQAFSLKHLVPTKECAVAILDSAGFSLALNPVPKEVKQGADVPVVVKAVRKEGIKGPVNVEVQSPPAGITVKPAPAVIAPEQAETTITLSIPKQAPVGLRVNLIVTGTLKTDKESFTRTAPAIPIKVIAGP